MAYSEALAERVRMVCGSLLGVTQKRMFGGVGFLLNGHMFAGIWKESLVARVGAERYPQLLTEPYAHEFDITGTALTGWILVDGDGVESDSQLRRWLDYTLEFAATLPPKSLSTKSSSPRKRARKSTPASKPSKQAKVNRRGKSQRKPSRGKKKPA